VAEDGVTAFLFGGRAGDASDELWAFDLTTDQWTRVVPNGPSPPARFGHTATWVPGVGLVVWSGQQGSTFFGDIWAYEPVANAWRELPSLGDVPPSRYGSCASLGPDGRLWISHGFTDDTGRFADTRTYDFATGEWADVTSPDEKPVERCLHDCYWSATGKLILYAGQTTGTPALGDIWAFVPETAQWERGPDQAAPARQLYALGVGAGDALVFGGGSVDRGYLADGWRVDDESLSLNPLDAGLGPTARSGATLINDDARSRMLLFGGLNEESALDDLWELSANT
jgi:hypothetical protein